MVSVDQAYMVGHMKNADGSINNKNVVLSAACEAAELFQCMMSVNQKLEDWQRFNHTLEMHLRSVECEKIHDICQAVYGMKHPSNELEGLYLAREDEQICLLYYQVFVGMLEININSAEVLYKQKEKQSMNKMEYMPVDCLQVPKVLFQMEKYKNLSNTAKILYSLFLDRLKFAVQNSWVDGKGDLYVIYPKSEMKKDLNTTRYGVDQAVQELVEIGNLVRIIPNNGKANHFYINDIYENEMEEESMMTLDRIMANMPLEEREIIMDKMVAASRDILKTIVDMGYLDEYDSEPMEGEEQEDFEDLEEEDFPTSGFEFGMKLAFKYLHENEEDFKRVRRLQQYLHRQYKDCSRKRYSIILEALAYAIDYDKSFIYDLSMADKKLKKMYLEDFMEGFDYALYDSRYEENEAEE